MIVYQILNCFGHPASNDFYDLCIFANIKEANAYIRYLKDEALCDTEYLTIKKRILF